MNRRLFHLSTLFAVCGVLAGCGALKANETARAEVRPGGIIDQNKQRSLNRRVEIDKERESLSDNEMNLKNELERKQRAIAAAQQEALAQDRQLAEAQADQRVSRQRIAELQERQRRLKGELAAADLQQKANPGSTPDPVKEREKEAKLEALRKRQVALKADIDAALSARR